MISFQNLKEFSHGGVKGTIKNFNGLSNFGTVDIYSIQKRSNLYCVLSFLEGYIPPILRSDLNNIIDLYRKNKYDFIFLDHSLLGICAYTLKKRFPACKIVTTYRNCEYDYIDVRFEKAQKFRKIIYRLKAKKMERMATQYSDLRVVLSKRDQNRIEDLYGIRPEIIIPQFLDDCFVPSTSSFTSSDKKHVLLFGPAGSANLEAFSWFIDNVSPHLNAITIVAGKRIDQYKSRFERDYTEVYGYVENIETLYQSADCVAIPLKKGGGMKFKTAEAMMFGKYIFGTREAFEGYDADISAFTKEYDCSDDFIAGINLFLKDNKRFYQESRACFLNNYSSSNLKKFYQQIVDYINK